MPVETPARTGAPLIEAVGLSKTFPSRGGALRRAGQPIRAVEGVDLAVWPGSTLGLVGESGSGKSTTARALLRLTEPTAGRILFGGRDVTQVRGRELRDFRRGVQMVFQDPYRSLNPRLSVGANVAEPLRVDGMPRRQRTARVAELFEQVGLNPADADRRPDEFSGGQRQRVAIARALAPQPGVVVLDEAVSALDVSVQAQVLNLLIDLRDRLNLGYLFISHDLAVVYHLCDRVAVMYLGRVVELGDREEVYANPRHPYTVALRSAVPAAPDEPSPPARRILAGEPPSPANPPSGCRFRTRCPKATSRCAEQAPPLLPVGSGGRLVACHYPEGS
jgi:peptide/nickel transport system ATP-binding protein